jgi:ABC-type transporter Mla subunit MlaD
MNIPVCRQELTHRRTPMTDTELTNATYTHHCRRIIAAAIRAPRRTQNRRQATINHAVAELGTAYDDATSAHLATALGAERTTDHLRRELAGMTGLADALRDELTETRHNLTAAMDELDATAAALDETRAEIATHRCEPLPQRTRKDAITEAVETNARILTARQAEPERPDTPPKRPRTAPKPRTAPATSSGKGRTAQTRTEPQKPTQ